MWVSDIPGISCTLTLFLGCFFGPDYGGKRKPMNTKHINIFLTAIAGQSSQDEPSPVPGTNGTKWRFYCGIQQKTAGLSQGWVPLCPRAGSLFVPGPVPVCPEHRPAKNDYVYWFFACLWNFKHEPRKSSDRESHRKSGLFCALRLTKHLHPKHLVRQF